MSSETQVGSEHLLTDIELANLIVNGYRIIEPDFPKGLNETIATALDELAENPGDGITEAVPELWQVLGHDSVRGVLISLLGSDYELQSHRHWHCRQPDSDHMQWHQDGTNNRENRMDRFLGLYYPREVAADMGPTIVVPGTQFRNAPTDRMATYTNIKGQVPLTVNAGTVAFTHYDIWHGTAANRTAAQRHMIKFLFRRTTKNTAPTWNHDPACLDQARDYGKRDMAQLNNILTFANPLGVGQSDHYKERAIRTQCWEQLMGSRSR